MYRNSLEKLKEVLLRKNPWFLVNAAFVFAFLIQSYSILGDLVHPTQTSNIIEEKTVNNWPILVKICIKPGFDLDFLKEEGYKDIDEYFFGKISMNKFWMGWKSEQKCQRSIRKGHSI